MVVRGSDIWNWKRLFPAGSAGKRRLPSGGGLLFNSTIAQSPTIRIAGSNPQRHTNNNNQHHQQLHHPPRTTMGLSLQINPFRLCSGLKALGYLMIVLVVVIVALSYYAVVILIWGPHLLDGGFISLFSFLVIILFHYLVVTILFSPFQSFSSIFFSIPQIPTPPLFWE